MSREELLNSLEEERSDAELLAEQEREVVNPLTPTPYNVLSEEQNPILFHGGLSGSLTRLANGDPYLVGGSNIEIASSSNGPITISVAVNGLNGAVAVNGLNGAVQFNDGGIMTEDSAFTFDKNAESLRVNNLSGSLTKLSNGDDYLVGGTDITMTTASNGSVTIDMDLMETDQWKAGSSFFHNYSTEWAPTDETVRGQLEVYRASDAAKSKLMSIKTTSTSFGLSSIISDEEGGLFAAGGTNTISAQGVKTGQLIHIDSSGSVTNFDVATNLLIRDILLSGSGADKTLFVGGDFTRVGHTVGPAFKINLSTNDASNLFEMSNTSSVTAMVKLSDGSIIIGGQFTRYGDITRNCLAKISPDGTLSSWNPGLRQTPAGSSSPAVNCLVVDEANDVLYVGGRFSHVGGGTGLQHSRNNLAAIKISDGTVTSWNPDALYNGAQPNAIIYSMALDSSNNRLYVGGTFTSLGNGGSAISVQNLGAVSTVDGSRINWSPFPNGAVLKIILDSANSLVYAGGQFTLVNQTSPQTRNRLAAFSTAVAGEAPPTSWNPNVSSTGAIVYEMGLDSSNNVMYAGGVFTTIGGLTRNRIAAVSTAPGNAGTVDSAWDPNANSTIYGIAISSDSVYISGFFSTVSGVSLAGLAKLPKANGVSTGTPVAFDYQTTTGVIQLFIDAGELYVYSFVGSVGGAGTSSGNYYIFHVARNRLFAIDANYRRLSRVVENKNTFLKAWNPSADNAVFSLEKDSSSNTIYVGGAFTRMGVNGDIPRQRMASVSSIGSGEVLSWSPFLNSTVNILKIDPGNNKIYVGGSFLSAGNSTTTRNRAAAFSTNYSPDTIQVQAGLALGSLSPVATPFPSSTGLITYGANENGTSGTSYRVINLSAPEGSTLSLNITINLLSGHSLTVTNLDTNTTVTSGFYAFGNLLRISGLAPGNYGIGIVSNATPGGATNGWRLDSVVHDVPVDSWNPNFDGTVLGLTLDSTNVYACGFFSNAGPGLSTRRMRVAAVDKTTGALTAWNPNLNMPAYVIKKQGDSVYVGGEFTGFVESSSSGLLYNTTDRLDRSGYVADLQTNGPIYASVALSDGSFIIGGAFTEAGGLTRNGLAKFSAAGVLDSAWNPGAYRATGMAVRSLAYNPAGNLLYVGGTFSRLGDGGGAAVGTSRSNLGLIYVSTGLPTTATIGSGTTTTTSTGSDPIDGYYKSFRYQVVYTASELTAAGMTANSTITGLGFSISDDYGGGNLLGYQIKLGHTSATNSAAHDLSSTTTVKNSFSYNPTATAAGSFDMITFDTSFVWNGVGNILVDICSSGLNPYISPYGTVRTIAATTTNGSRFVRSDVSSQCGVATTTLNNTKPQIRFNYVTASTTGVVDPTWDPGCPDSVYALLLDTTNSRLYVGGSFVGSLGGSSRTRLGAVSSTGTGTAIDWNPAVTSGVVHTFARNVASNLLYVGGTFNGVGVFAGANPAVNYLGAVSTTATGTVTADSFNPGANGNVFGLVYDSALATPGLYCVGNFTTIGGLSRNRVATLNTNGTAWSWAPISTGLTTSNMALALDVSRERVHFASSLSTSLTTTSLALSNTITTFPSSLISTTRPTTGNTSPVFSAWSPGLYGAINTLSLNSSGVLLVGMESSTSNFKTTYDTNRVIKLSALSNTFPGILENWSNSNERQSDSVRSLYVGNVFDGEYVVTGGDDASLTVKNGSVSFGTSQARHCRFSVDNGMMSLSLVFNTSNNSGAVAGNGHYIISLPQGFGIDTSKVTLGSVKGYYSDFSNATMVGIGTIRGPIGGGGAWALIPISQTQMVLVGKDPASNQVVVWGQNAFPMTTTNGIKVSINAKIPVVTSNLL